MLEAHQRGLVQAQVQVQVQVQAQVRERTQPQQVPVPVPVPVRVRGLVALGQHWGLQAQRQWRTQVASSPDGGSPFCSRVGPSDVGGQRQGRRLVQEWWGSHWHHRSTGGEAHTPTKDQGNVQTNTQTNKHAAKQTHKQTNTQPNKQTNKQTNNGPRRRGETFTQSTALTAGWGRHTLTAGWAAVDEAEAVL